MRTLLVMAAILGTATAPAAAQTTAPPQPAPATKPQTVTKVVCERVRDGETGSRVGTTRKVCKKVEVPAEAETQKSQPQGHGAHAH